MRKLMLSAVIIGILGSTVESQTLDAEAIEYVKQQEFPKAFSQCQGLWYIRWFIGNAELTPQAEMERSNEWVVLELKNIIFKITPMCFSGDPRKIDLEWTKETDIEWIGIVLVGSESDSRLYSAKTRKWEIVKGETTYGVMLKKRAGAWYIMDTFRNIGLMPNLSCRGIAALRK